MAAGPAAPMAEVPLIFAEVAALQDLSALCQELP
jgi:hypothetical protein